MKIPGTYSSLRVGTSVETRVAFNADPAALLRCAKIRRTDMRRHFISARMLPEK
jgi:hypothetical protein